MESFRSDVQLRVMTLNAGETEVMPILDGVIPPGLNDGIIKVAQRNIKSNGQFAVFMLAFKCIPTWEEIHKIYEQRFPHDGEGLDLETIKRYAREGRNKVLARPKLPKVS